MKHKEVSPLLQTHDAVIRTFFCFRKHFEVSWVGREGDSADNTIYSSVDSRGTTDQTAKSWTHTRRDQYQKSRGESGGAFQYIIHSTSPHLRQLPNTFMMWSLDLVWSALVRTRRRMLRVRLFADMSCLFLSREGRWNCKYVPLLSIVLVSLFLHLQSTARTIMHESRTKWRAWMSNQPHYRPYKNNTNNNSHFLCYHTPAILLIFIVMSNWTELNGESSL